MSFQISRFVLHLDFGTIYLSTIVNIAMPRYTRSFQKNHSNSVHYNDQLHIETIKLYYMMLTPMCFYLVLVVGLVCANDTESYVGGSVATGRASQAEQGKG
jgi:divalent metal cation (Fe/Co/Zn/Cd) transporter